MDNQKKVLFSPVGSTDPISGEYDGALLHIIRKYRPRKVYLYLSKEICEFEDKDSRYSYCLDRLREHLGYDFETEWIRRENLTEVQLFDYFFTEFRDILTRICDENGDAEILLNVSSGTPAIKSALQFLTAFFERPMIPIQVSTPRKKINNKEKIKEYEPDIQWECNCDNNEDYRDRCAESSIRNLSNEIRRNIIKKHCLSYDYVAAFAVADPISDCMDEEAFKLIKAATYRLKLDRSSCDSILKDVDYEMFPETNSQFCMIFEYIALLYIKVKREEYADFVRAISPVFFRLEEQVLTKAGVFDIDKYTYHPKDRNKEVKKSKKILIRKWKKDAVDADEKLREALNLRWDELVNTSHYERIISKLNLNVDEKSRSLVRGIRDAEENIRNIVAHNMIPVTDDIIKLNSGKSSQEIFKEIKKLADLSGVPKMNRVEETYDELNKRIIGLLDN